MDYLSAGYFFGFPGNPQNERIVFLKTANQVSAGAMQLTKIYGNYIAEKPTEIHPEILVQLPI